MSEIDLSAPEIQEAIATAAAEQAAALTDEAVQGLKGKNTELLSELKRTKGKLKTLPEDFDPDEWTALREAQAHAEEEKAKEAGRWDELRMQLTEKHNAQLADREKRESDLLRELQNTLIGTATLDAITKHRGNPQLLRPHVESQIKMVEEEGRFVTRVIDLQTKTERLADDGKPLTVAQLVEEMRHDETYAPLFEGSRAAGSGAGGSGGASGAGGTVNPWSEKHFNMTEQGRIMKENPELAARLKSVA